MYFFRLNDSTYTAAEAKITEKNLTKFREKYADSGIEIEYDEWEDVVEINSSACEDRKIARKAELDLEDLVTPASYITAAAYLAAAKHY